MSSETNSATNSQTQGSVSLSPVNPVVTSITDGRAYSHPGQDLALGEGVGQIHTLPKLSSADLVAYAQVSKKTNQVYTNTPPHILQHSLGAQARKNHEHAEGSYVKLKSLLSTLKEHALLETRNLRRVPLITELKQHREEIEEVTLIIEKTKADLEKAMGQLKILKAKRDALPEQQQWAYESTPEFEKADSLVYDLSWKLDVKTIHLDNLIACIKRDEDYLEFLDTAPQKLEETEKSLEKAEKALVKAAVLVGKYFPKQDPTDLLKLLKDSPLKKDPPRPSTRPLEITELDYFFGSSSSSSSSSSSMPSLPSSSSSSSSPSPLADEPYIRYDEQDPFLSESERSLQNKTKRGDQCIIS